MSWAFSVNVLVFFEKRPLQSRPYETPNFALERATPTKSPPGGKNLTICRKNKHVVASLFSTLGPFGTSGEKKHDCFIANTYVFSSRQDKTRQDFGKIFEEIVTKS